VVARVRAAGAIFCGKTNTPEFTLSFVTDNLIYGATRNPYNLEYQPSGSSGGAAAIVAAGGSAFDIGSDYAGSIRVPSHACGVAGIKPTHGLVPRTGHIIDYGGYSDSMQQIGPLARRVEDLALLLPILAGPDNLDAAIAPVPIGGLPQGRPAGVAGGLVRLERPDGSDAGDRKGGKRLCGLSHSRRRKVA